jgi:ABC-type transport system substrate-binding protein
MLGAFNRRLVFLGLVLLLAAIIIACGEEATATAEPSATQAAAPTVTAAATVAAAPTAAAVPATGATPTATPVPTPAPTETVMSGPSGSLNVGMAEVAPVSHVLHLQTYSSFKYDTLMTHETMFRRDKNGKLHGMLVKEWDVDPAGLVWNFRFQEGVPWHSTFGDWGEFSADDFIFSLENVTTEGSRHGSSGRIRRDFFCEGCSLTKIDDYTIRLERPSVSVQITWDSYRNGGGSVAMISKNHVETNGEDQANFESVGTGSWRLVEAKTDNFRRVEAVADHWRKTPEFAEMTWTQFGEESTRLANFITGDLDTGQFSLESIAEIKQGPPPGVDYMVFPGQILWRFNQMGHNYYNDHEAHLGDNPPVPLGDPAFTCDIPYISCERDVNSEEWINARKVRRALSIAIDRQKLVNNLAFGEGEPWYVNYWTKSHIEQWGVDDLVIPYDPEMAMQLLEEAGYPDGFELDMVVTDRPPGSDVVGQAVATMWQIIGVEAVIKRLPYVAYRPTLVNRTATEYHSYNNTPSSPEPLDWYSLFHSTANGFNFGAQHPELEALLEKAAETPDERERFEVQSDIARWLFDQELAIPLFGENMVWPISSKLGRWEVGAGTIDWLGNWEDAPRRQ